MFFQNDIFGNSVPPGAAGGEKHFPVDFWGRL